MARGSFGRIGAALAAAGLVAAAASPVAAQQLDKWWKIKFYESQETFDYYPITLRVDYGRAKHKYGSSLTPAAVASLENRSDEPMCAALYFKTEQDGYNELFESGNGAAYLIKAGKTQKVAATVYSRSGRAQQFGFGTMVVHSWHPSGKKSCGGDPNGRPDFP